MLHCFKCGADHADNLNYCLHCGNPLDDAPETVVRERVFRSSKANVDVPDEVFREVAAEKTEDVTVRPFIRYAAVVIAWAGGPLIAAIITAAVLTGGAFLIGSVFRTFYHDPFNQLPPANYANANTMRHNPLPARTPRPPQPSPEPEPPKPPPEPKRMTLINDQVAVPPGLHFAVNFSVERTSRLTGGFRVFGGSRDIRVLLSDSNGMRYLDSEYIDRGRPSVRLGPGRYTLKFDNGKALMTGKSVAAELFLTASE